ncbi:Na+/H+ antiporter NhaC [Labilibaculum sp. A4]|uniref:Na+/H+ antiporter NhaC n=1 Tax=Labilibaculum euxinus TaxID=2686357 RepID=UPI000F61C859|nr:Na+/H+ antiporter NhaC [Labilibaculum euxinus]MDQ1769634.1 Na+/H+ antiporter NhaC [Labilibaculum euxinus]MWN76191.1 Na+/H+ antiporter NhaC [Labilibaculum euxinus]
MNTKNKTISLWESLIPIILLIILLSVNAIVFGDGAIEGANQFSLLIAAAIGGLIALRHGKNWDDLQKGIVESISTAMPSMLILLLIGSLAGTWMISGVVPAMIYYGLEFLNPKLFLMLSVVICAIVSVVTGSSWSTIATIGVALLGVGNAMEYNNAIVAGAIISGAYFGDKISPLSDTTNLASAMAEVDLFVHIRYMMYTTIPSILITLLIFLAIGFNKQGEINPESIREVQIAIKETFTITPWLFLVPILLFVIISKKVPALPAIFAGTLIGGVFAIIFQPQIIQQISGSGSYIQACYHTVMQSIFTDVSIPVQNKNIQDLLSTGGMAGMLNTIWLILTAMVFSGVLETAGILHKITATMLKAVSSTGSLVTTTVASCGFLNLTASDQYISIVVTGRMFSESYKDQHLKPEVLSRTLEDAGTVTSVLVPWNTCGAAQAGALGVATVAFAPFCFFNIISPIMTIAVAYLNIKIRKTTDPAVESAQI